MKSQTLLTWIAISISVFCPPWSKALANGDQEIIGFHYASCSARECVDVRAPKAYLSTIGFGFSTVGPTELKVIDITGQEKAHHWGQSASFSPILNLVTLEKSDDDIVLYSISEQKLTEYGAAQKPLRGTQK